MTTTIRSLFQHRIQAKIKKSLVLIFCSVLCFGPATLLVGHASATTNQAVVGMPFSGKWAYNVLVNPPYTDSNSSHPSVHHTPAGGDWGTDLYAEEGSAVKLDIPIVTGALTFSWRASTTSCGQATGVNINVDGTTIGWQYYAHLANAVTTGTITNGMTLGTVHDWVVANVHCNPGVHVHTELKNTTNYSCYVDNGQAGVTLSYDTNFAVLGSSNTGAKQACTSIPSPPATATPTGTDTLGTYDPTTATFYLRDFNTPGPAGVSVQFGNANWIPLAGDWDGNGTFTPGAYDPATGWFYLRNSHTPGPADTSFQYGNIGWKPIAGDWDGNGYWSVGLYDPNTAIFYLKNYNGPGGADMTFPFGNSNWLPIAGDWDGNDDGNANTTIGVYNPTTATYYLNNENDSSAAESTIQYGNANWTPLAGDWDGNRFASIGAYDPTTATFYLRNSNTPGPADVTVQYGNAGWKPVMGDWDGQ